MSVVVVGAVGYDTIETQNGNAVEVLGGSGVYFSLACRFFAPVSLVAAVGTDFKPEDRQLLLDRSIDLRGLESREGLTFRWHGRYHEDMNKRDTLNLALNVFADFAPELLPDQRCAGFVFLANISPQLQIYVLDQMASPRVAAADTMSHWIENSRPELIKLMSRLDILTLNDEEACMLSGEHNLVKAGQALLKMGPKTALIKRGENGVLQFSKEGLFAVPAYPLEEVHDPTGAGDTFAGAFMGCIARNSHLDERGRRSAVVYGSVMASYVVERFSVQRIVDLTWDDIDDRYRAFLALTDSH
jgi:sugar/nucleoside kinase (ribokinase family)